MTSRIFCLGLLFLQLPLHARADLRTEPSQIGPHEALITVEKSENPQNIMIVYSKVDKDCRFMSSDSQPLVDYYWLMDGSRYKPVHPLIKRGIRDRLKVEDPSASHQAFNIKIEDLQNVKTDLKAAEFSVRAQIKNGKCEAFASLALGPSDQNRVLQLMKISTVTSKGFNPLSRKIESITLSGLDSATGKPYSRKYEAN